MTRFPRAVCRVEPLGECRTGRKPIRSAHHTLRRIVRGTASGWLTGGNLAMIVSTFGTRWEINTRGAILFFEEG